MAGFFMAILNLIVSRKYGHSETVFSRQIRFQIGAIPFFHEKSKNAAVATHPECSFRSGHFLTG
jgi:hypothetical protein